MIGDGLARRASDFQGNMRGVRLVDDSKSDFTGGKQDESACPFLVFIQANNLKSLCRYGFLSFVNRQMARRESEYGKRRKKM